MRTTVSKNEQNPKKKKQGTTATEKKMVIQENLRKTKDRKKTSLGKTNKSNEQIGKTDYDKN